MSDGGYDRRQVAGRIAAAALLPFAALGAPLSAARPRARAAPSGSYALQRVLTRELGDGAAIAITRRWRIAFAPREGGLLVAGEQTFADVAAPAPLAPLAALERSRCTSRLFPIALDALGRIANGESGGMDAAQLLQAIETGRAMLGKGAGAATLAGEAGAFLAELSRLGAEAVSTMPRDLFFPAPARSEAERKVALPQGGTGTVSVATQASADPDTGLLRASERVIATRVASSLRISREAWSLTHA